MRVGTLLTAVCAAAALAAPRAEAQLVAMGEQGVVMGAVRVTGSDLEKQKAFWAELDGKPVMNGTLQLMQFPGAYVALAQGAPTGGTEGSVMNHIGFNVKHMADWLPRWQAAGIVQAAPRPTQTYLMGPDGVRVEILEDTTIANAIQFHHLHWFTQAPPLELQEWYFQNLGAVKGKRGNFDAGDLPGVNLTFSASQEPVVGTEGRSVSAVGFEVRGLEALVDKLEANGVTIARGYQKMGNSNLATAVVVDPWGTRISLSEGLTPGTASN